MCKMNVPNAEAYALSILSNMAEYFRQGVLTDVTISVGDKSIPAHRNILCAASKFFARNLMNGDGTPGMSELTIEGISDDVVSNLITFCYTGVPVIEENAVQLYEGARLLQLELMEAACVQTMTVSNCSGTWDAAEKMGCLELEKMAQSYLMEHFEEFLKDESFVNLSLDQLHALLSSDDLSVRREDVVVEALTTWVEHDLKNRSNDVNRLFHCVRLPYLTKSVICDGMMNSPLFNLNMDCLRALMGIRRTHGLPSLHDKPRQWRDQTQVLIDISDGSAYKWNLPTRTFERCNIKLNTHFTAKVTCYQNYILSYDDRTGVIHCLNTLTNALAVLPPLENPRTGVGLAVLEGFVYVIGGLEGNSQSRSFERFNPSTWSWESMADTNSLSFTNPVIAIAHDCIYAFDSTGNVECYSSKTNTWKVCSSNREEVECMGIGVMDGFIYTVDGWLHHYLLTGVSRYDPVTDTWTTLAKLPHICLGAAVFCTGNRLLVVGENTTNHVQSYDPVTNTWEILPPLPLKVYTPVVVGLPDDIVVSL